MGKIEAKAGQVVLIDFPFIDNSRKKKRSLFKIRRTN